MMISKNKTKAKQEEPAAGNFWLPVFTGTDADTANELFMVFAFEKGKAGGGFNDLVAFAFSLDQARNHANSQFLFGKVTQIVSVKGRRTTLMEERVNLNGSIH